MVDRGVTGKGGFYRGFFLDWNGVAITEQLFNAQEFTSTEALSRSQCNKLNIHTHTYSTHTHIDAHRKLLHNIYDIQFACTDRVCYHCRCRMSPDPHSHAWTVPGTICEDIYVTDCGLRVVSICELTERCLFRC